MPTLTDTSPMPLGKYKGVAMQDVPVSYLHWYYHNTQDNYGNIAIYIRQNLDALKLENKDLIWERK